MTRKLFPGLLLAASVALAQNASLPRYRVIEYQPHNPVKTTPALNALADQGYRFLFAGRQLIVRLDATPPDTYRYLPLPEGGVLNSLLNQLNQQGALGYGWLKNTEFLEKEPHPRNFEYTHVQGIADKTRKANLESLLTQGFVLAGDFVAQPIYMREIGVTQEPALRPSRIVNAGRQSTLVQKIAELATLGYRYRGPTRSLTGGAWAAEMEECGFGCGGPFNYRSIDTKGAAQLKHDLNALGEEGFHVLPDSLRWGPQLAERPAEHRQHYQYRVARAEDVKACEEFVNAGDRDGFAPIGFTAHSGWTLQVYLILEKVLPAAP